MKGQCFKQWQKLLCSLASYKAFPVPPWLCWSCLVSDWAAQGFLSQLLTSYKLSIIFLWHNWLRLLKREEPSDSQSHSSAVYIRLSHNFSKTWVFPLVKNKGTLRRESLILFQTPQIFQILGELRQMFWLLLSVWKSRCCVGFWSAIKKTFCYWIPIQTEIQITRDFIIVLEKLLLLNS